MLRGGGDEGAAPRLRPQRRHLHSVAEETRGLEAGGTPDADRADAMTASGGLISLLEDLPLNRPAIRSSRAATSAFWPAVGPLTPPIPESASLVPPSAASMSSSTNTAGWHSTHSAHAAATAFRAAAGLFCSPMFTQITRAGTRPGSSWAISNSCATSRSRVLLPLPGGPTRRKPADECPTFHPRLFRERQWREWRTGARLDTSETRASGNSDACAGLPAPL